jgi:hypothetical protein
MGRMDLRDEGEERRVWGERMRRGQEESRRWGRARAGEVVADGNE